MLCFLQKSLVPATLLVQLVSFVMFPILLKAYGPALFVFLVQKAAAEDIFPGCKSNTDNPKVALPIIHSSADFVIPIRTGQVLQIDIKPEKINPGSFQVISNFNYENKLAARVLVRHVAISTDTRKHCLLPKNIQLWLEASSIGDTVKPL